MSLDMTLERVHTINLGKAWLSVDTHRATRAINMIREYARRHTKATDVKIDESVAHTIWRRGARHPPRRIRVVMDVAEGTVHVNLYEGRPIEPAKPAIADEATSALAGPATTELPAPSLELPDSGTQLRDEPIQDGTAPQTQEPQDAAQQEPKPEQSREDATQEPPQTEPQDAAQQEPKPEQARENVAPEQAAESKDVAQVESKPEQGDENVTPEPATDSGPNQKKDSQNSDSKD